MTTTAILPWRTAPPSLRHRNRTHRTDLREGWQRLRPRLLVLTAKQLT